MTRFPKCILENPGTQGEPYRRTMQSHTFWKCGILLLNWRNAIYINWGEWDTVSQIYFTTNPLEHSTEACEAYCTLFWTPAKKSPSQLHHIGRPHLLQSPEGHHIQHLTVVSLVSTFPFLLFPSAFPPPPPLRGHSAEGKSLLPPQYRDPLYQVPSAGRSSVGAVRGNISQPSSFSVARLTLISSLL